MVLRKVLCGLATTATLAIASSPHVQAQEQPFYRNGSWAVFKSQRMCTLLGTFQSDMSLYISYEVTQNNAALMIASERFTSINKGDSFRLNLSFIQNDKIVKNYEDLQFFGNRFLREPSVLHNFEGRKFLEEFATADVIGVSFPDHTILGSFRLNGAAGAIGALKRCARIEAGFGADDPFADMPRR